MKKIITLSLVFILIGTVVFAQNYKGKGRVIGFVYDEEQKPIEGVKVKLFSHLANDGFEVFTDAAGKWVAAWLRGGSWDLDFEKVGFEPRRISVEFHQYQRNPDITLTLKALEGLLLTDELKKALTESNNLFAEGKYQESITAYEAILLEYPDAYIINKNIGNAYFQMENYVKAEEYYQKVLELDAESNDIKLAIGNCCANRGESEQALEWYGKISFDELKDPIVLYNIGTNYYNLGKIEDALKYYKRSVEIQENFEDGLYQLGLAYLALTRYKESLEVFEKYLKFDSETGRADQVKSFIDFLKTKIGG
ncbi:MAG: tetratricopeptide repeat protein [Acidobacteriota bacterium]